MELAAMQSACDGIKQSFVLGLAVEGKFGGCGRGACSMRQVIGSGDLGRQKEGLVVSFGCACRLTSGRPGINGLRNMGAEQCDRAASIQHRQRSLLRLGQRFQNEVQEEFQSHSIQSTAAVLEYRNELIQCLQNRRRE
jgi:hypothetical protein